MMFCKYRKIQNRERVKSNKDEFKSVPVKNNFIELELHFYKLHQRRTFAQNGDMVNSVG